MSSATESSWRASLAFRVGALHLVVVVASFVLLLVGLRVLERAGEGTSYAWIVACAALAGVLGGALLARRAVRPIRELTVQTERIAREPGARLPQRTRADELDRLIASVNDALARRDRLVSGMRDALDQLAHDLRAPITHVRGTAELALLHGDASRCREALADIVEECDRVLALLRSLTELAAAEGGAMRLERHPLDLRDVVHDVVDLYAHVAEHAGITLRAYASEPARLSADRVRVTQALANLVDNAIKFTPAGGSVAVEAHEEGTWAVLRVRDTGIGIAPEVLPRVWDRLYRADTSRPGAGLGLSVVEAIVAAHGGQARATSAPGRGSIFELRFPLHER